MMDAKKKRMARNENREVFSARGLAEVPTFRANRTRANVEKQSARVLLQSRGKLTDIVFAYQQRVPRIQSRWNAIRPRWVGWAHVNSAMHHTCLRRGKFRPPPLEPPKSTHRPRLKSHFPLTTRESYAKRDSCSPIVNIGLCSVIEYASCGRRVRKQMSL